MLISTRSTDEPSASLAIRKPTPFSGPAIAARCSGPSRTHVEPASPTASWSLMSVATTSDAPRFSSSKARKPSYVPTSRQRLPRTSGHGIRSTIGRRSNQPGVTTPGASSIVWYQSGLSRTRASRSAVMGVVVGAQASIQVAAVSRSARKRDGAGRSRRASSCSDNMYPPHHLGGYELSCRDVVDRWRDERTRGRSSSRRTARVRGVEDPPGEAARACIAGCASTGTITGSSRPRRIAVSRSSGTTRLSCATCSAFPDPTSSRCGTWERCRWACSRRSSDAGSRWFS